MSAESFDLGQSMAGCDLQRAEFPEIAAMTSSPRRASLPSSLSKVAQSTPMIRRVVSYEELLLLRFGEAMQILKDEADKAVPSSGPLSGTVLYVSGVLARLERDIQVTAASLGGRFRHIVDDSCTHIIHQGSVVPEEVRGAMQRGKLVVAPQWVYACDEEGTKVDEKLFPPTCQPARDDLDNNNTSVENVMDVSNCSQSNVFTTDPDPDMTMEQTCVALERTDVAPNNRTVTGMEDQQISVFSTMDTSADITMEQSLLPLDRTGIAPHNRPVIAVTGITEGQEKSRLVSVVKSLGGVVSRTWGFDPSCTHIVGCLARNEKILGSIASGKWVLHKSYLEACKKERRFVEEDQYEWGGPSLQDVHSTLPPHYQQLAQCIPYWRHKLSQDCEAVGAFSGWTVIVFTSGKSISNFTRLLVAGGACVLANKPPYSPQLTHAFIDTERQKTGAVTVDTKPLVSAGVPCLEIGYIAAFLVSTSSPPPIKDFLVEQARVARHRSNLKRKHDVMLRSSPKRRRTSD